MSATMSLGLRIIWLTAILVMNWVTHLSVQTTRKSIVKKEIQNWNCFQYCALKQVITFALVGVEIVGSSLTVCLIANVSNPPPTLFSYLLISSQTFLWNCSVYIFLMFFILSINLEVIISCPFSSIDHILKLFSVLVDKKNIIDDIYSQKLSRS